MRSGELARLAAVSSDTLRHYERVGVLGRPARSAAGYRQYAPEALDRVRVIRRALAVGFSLKELTRVFRVREQGGAPCREVRALAAGKLAEVDRRITEMIALREHLQELLQQWDKQLKKTPKGAQAHLLEGLGKGIGKL
jgi:DNA-binding transcriptional MerR regulator